MHSHSSGVYEILNTANGKRYIGSAVDFSRRQKQHKWGLRKGKHHSAKLQHAWDKYGESAFKFLPILTCQKSVLLFYEQQLLDKVKPEYNVAVAAENPMLGRTHSAETKKKMSAVQKGGHRGVGRAFSAEHKEKLAARHRGTKRSAETCAKISAAKTGKPVRARPPMSDETKAKISAANTGRKMTEANRAALSKRMVGNSYALGVVYSEEDKARIAVAKLANATAKQSEKK